MINTIFYFPESLTYDQYLNALDKESEDGIASRTIVLAKRQNMIYNNGAIFGSIPGLVNYEEFADTISTLNLALEGKANASEYLPLSGGTITGRLITEGSLNAQGKVNVSNQLSITSSSGPEDDPEYYQFTLENGVINIDDSTVIDRDSVASDKFVKNGGTSEEFLKADGSVDDNTYLTEHQELKTINNQSLIGEGNITIEDNQIQTDWNQTDTTKVDYIKNKPTIPTSLSQLSGDETHRTVTDTEKEDWNNKSEFSGNYDDLSNKPTIDETPTEDSTNAVSSGGVYSEFSYLGKDVNLYTKISGTEASSNNPVTPDACEDGDIFYINKEAEGDNYSGYVKGIVYYIAKGAFPAEADLTDASQFDSTYSSAEALRISDLYKLENVLSVASDAEIRAMFR